MLVRIISLLENFELSLKLLFFPFIEMTMSKTLSLWLTDFYWSSYELPTPDLVSNAFDYIYEVIEEEGPFDGVFGFSQGAALASSMMLQHAKSNPYSDLFKFAVFLGASLPFNLDDSSGLEQWETATKNAKCGIASSMDGQFSGELETSETSSDEDEAEDTHTRGFPLRPWLLGNQTLLARYNPILNPSARIHAPTLHVYGTQDPYFGQSEMLVKLCAGEVITVKHGEGHRVPRDRTFEKQTIAAMDSILKMVMMAHWLGRLIPHVPEDIM
jgi:pimeloyl-ACP methyl ester carboxylesterase